MSECTPWPQIHAMHPLTNFHSQIHAMHPLDKDVYKPMKQQKLHYPINSQELIGSKTMKPSMIDKLSKAKTSFISRIELLVSGYLLPGFRIPTDLLYLCIAFYDDHNQSLNPLHFFQISKQPCWISDSDNGYFCDTIQRNWYSLPNDSNDFVYDTEHSYHYSNKCNVLFHNINDKYHVLLNNNIDNDSNSKRKQVFIKDLPKGMQFSDETVFVTDKLKLLVFGHLIGYKSKSMLFSYQLQLNDNDNIITTNSNSDKWKHVSCVPHRPCAQNTNCCMIGDDILYIQSHSHLSQIYDFELNKWTVLMRKQKRKRQYFGIEYNKLFECVYIGGGSSSQNAQHVEYHDLIKDEWFKLPDTNLAHKFKPKLRFEGQCNNLLHIASIQHPASIQHDPEKNYYYKVSRESFDLRDNKQNWTIHCNHVSNCRLNSLSGKWILV